MSAPKMILPQYILPSKNPFKMLVPYSVDPDQLASQKLADLDLHS